MTQNLFKLQITSYLLTLRDQMSQGSFDTKKGLSSRSKNYIFSDAEIEEFALRSAGFIEDSNKMCRLWHSKKLTSLREMELDIQGSSPVYKIKCIDGRKPRGYEGEADSLKSEKAQLALSRIPSSGQVIPLGADVCVNLSDSTKEPIEMSLAHYDSLDPHHGCAAMGLVLKDFMNNITGTWQFLTPEEVDLVQQAAASSQEYGNVILLELTNRVAVENIHNHYRVEHGMKPLARVGITALFDTRTMGIELLHPIVIKDPKTGKLTLPNFDFLKKLSTTVLTLKHITEIQNIAGELKVGSFSQKFDKMNCFTEYSEALVKLSKDLCNKATNLNQEVDNYLNENYSDFTPSQLQALKYRIIRTVVHQFITGLFGSPEKHLYSDHGERFSSIADDGNYPGKYTIEYQCFRMSGPDPKTSARRLKIASLVMDKINLDQGKPHVAFFSTSITQSNYDKNDKQDAIRESVKFFRGLMEEKDFKALVDSKNTIPVPVLTIRETGEVVEVITSNALYY